MSSYKYNLNPWPERRVSNVDWSSPPDVIKLECNEDRGVVIKLDSPPGDGLSADEESIALNSPFVE